MTFSVSAFPPLSATFRHFPPGRGARQRVGDGAADGFHGGVPGTQAVLGETHAGRTQAVRGPGTVTPWTRGSLRAIRGECLAWTNPPGSAAHAPGLYCEKAAETWHMWHLGSCKCSMCDGRSAKTAPTTTSNSSNDKKVSRIEVSAMHDSQFQCLRSLEPSVAVLSSSLASWHMRGM